MLPELETLDSQFGHWSFSALKATSRMFLRPTCLMSIRQDTWCLSFLSPSHINPIFPNHLSSWKSQGEGGRRAYLIQKQDDNITAKWAPSRTTVNGSNRHLDAVSFFHSMPVLLKTMFCFCFFLQIHIVANLIILFSFSLDFSHYLRKIELSTHLSLVYFPTFPFSSKIRLNQFL